METDMPTIPIAFIKKPKVSQSLQFTVDQFSKDDQKIIYLYCLVKLSHKEIHDLTNLPLPRITTILDKYKHSLDSKLNLYKTALPYDPTDTIDTSDLLELELLQAM